MISAFGIDHGLISKKKMSRKDKVATTAAIAGPAVGIPGMIAGEVAQGRLEDHRDQHQAVKRATKIYHDRFVTHRLAEEAAEPYRTRVNVGNRKALPAGSSTTNGPHAHWTAGRSPITESYRKTGEEGAKFLANSARKIKRIKSVRNAAFATGAAGLGAGILGSVHLENKKKRAQRRVSKSFLRMGKEGPKAIKAVALSTAERGQLRQALEQTRSTRIKGKLKPAGNAQKRPPQAAERFRNRSHDKRYKAWVDAGMPKNPPKPPDNMERNPMFSRRLIATTGLTAAVSAGAGAEVHRRNKNERMALSKADGKRHHGTEALGAVSGLAGAETAHTVFGQTVKHAASAHRRKHWDPKVHKPIWDAHRQKYGVDQVTGKTPHALKQQLYENYPKEIPGGRAMRVVAIKNRPEIYGSLLAAGAVGGAALAHHGRKQRLAKAGGRTAAMDALRWGSGIGVVGSGAGGAVYGHTHDKRKAGEAVAGGLVGQGAYQGAMYTAKHRALHAEAKAGLSRSKKDKVLKPVKRAHGAFTKEMYRHYPHELPAWKTNRALGYLARGKTGMAVGGALTVGGGATALAVARHHKKEKTA